MATVLEMRDLKEVQERQQVDKALEAQEFRASVVKMLLTEKLSPADALEALKDADISVDEFERIQRNDDSAWNRLRSAAPEQMVSASEEYFTERLNWDLSQIRWQTVGRLSNRTWFRAQLAESLDAVDRVTIRDADAPLLTAYVSAVRAAISAHDAWSGLQLQFSEARVIETRCELSLSRVTRDKEQDFGLRQSLDNAVAKLDELNPQMTAAKQSLDTAMTAVETARNALPQLRAIVVTAPAPVPVVVPAVEQPEPVAIEETESFTL
jgi:hypothetical protein